MSKFTTIMHKMRLPYLLPMAGLLFIGAQSASMAGYYSVAYSGGTTEHRGGYVTVGPSQWGGNDGQNGPLAIDEAECSGTVTGTFTWHPSGAGDNPPASVTVTKWTYVQFIVSVGKGWGYYDDGFGGYHLVTTQLGCNASKSTTVVDPPISNPGTTFTATVSPDAYCSCVDFSGLVGAAPGTTVKVSMSAS